MMELLKCAPRTVTVASVTGGGGMESGVNAVELWQTY